MTPTTPGGPGPINQALWKDESFTYLKGLRTQADPEADRAVAAYLAESAKQGLSADKVAIDLMLQIARSPWASLRQARESLLRGMGGGSTALHDFIRDHSAPPAWADRALITHGEKLFEDYGPLSVMSLLCASLPECYSHKNGALVLWYTLELEEHSVRRVYETARMILSVMTPGGLEPEGAGVLTAIKTRLLHAVMRHIIKTQPARRPVKPTDITRELYHGKWDVEQWGEPVNLEDNAFTLLTFGYVVLRSLRRLGMQLSTDDEKAYLHCWNVVAYYLGIPPELCPVSMEDAELMFDQCQKHQQSPSPEGKALTGALTDVMMRLVPNRKVAELLNNALMRFLLSEHTPEVLGLPPEGLFDHAIKLATDLWTVLNKGANAVVNVVGAVDKYVWPLPITRRVMNAVDEVAWRVGGLVTRVIVAQLRPDLDETHAADAARKKLEEKLGRLQRPGSAEELMDRLGNDFAKLLLGDKGMLQSIRPLSGFTPPAPPSETAAAPAQAGPPRPRFLRPEAWDLPLKERLKRIRPPKSDVA